MNKSTAIGFIIVLSLFFLVIWGRSCSQTDLKKNGIIVNAKVVTVHVGGKGGSSLDCEFYYKNEKHEASSPFTYLHNPYDLTGRIFPAMYSPKSSAFEILITYEDFSKFSMKVPDSLKEIKLQQ